MMARDHARISLGIWSDDDWRDLSPRAQHLYFVLLTQPTLTYAGVADWRPARLRALAGGWGHDEFELAAAELARGLYIVVDEDTEEVLIRSFVKHDGLMKQPNMAVSMVRAYEATASRAIRGVFIHELNRLRETAPELGGWKSCQHLLGNRSIDPATHPTNYPSVDPSIEGESTPSGKGCPTPSPSPSPTSMLQAPAKNMADGTRNRVDYSPEFETFWAAYPRKEAKRQAWKAWGKAIERATPERITAGASRYANDPNREEQFTKHGSTWLNADGWEDEPLPAPSRRPGPVENTLDAWSTPAGQTPAMDFIDGEVVEFRRALP